MPSPGAYEAPQEYMKSLSLGDEVFAKRQADFSDPVRMFESTGSDVDGTIRQWLTLDITMKKRVLTQLAVVPPPLMAEHATENDRVQYESSLRNRWRTLNFIIQEESRSSKGSREIAALAFASLFPQQRQ